MKLFLTKYICLVLAALLPVLKLNAQEQIIDATDFENGMNGWQHYPASQEVKWQRGTGTVSRIETNTATTGPKGAQSGSVFLYIDNYRKKPVGEVAIIKSFDFTNYTNPVLSFYYHNEDGGNLYPAVLRIESHTLRPTDPNYHEQGLWNEYDQDLSVSPSLIQIHGEDWVKVSVCMANLGGKSYAEIKISSLIQNSPCANVAIDNLKIENFIIDDDPKNFKNATCHGYDNGKITIKPKGGGPVYKYSLNGDDQFEEETTVTSKTFENIVPKDYQIAVKDVKSGCVARLPNKAVYITQPAEIEVNIEIEDVSCYATPDGKITVTASESTGNVTPYYYSATKEEFSEETKERTYPNGTSNQIGGLPGGVYYVRVRNGNDCISKDKEVKLGESVKMQISEVEFSDIIDNKGCFGDKKGKIEITAESMRNIRYSIDGGKTYSNEYEDDDNRKFWNLPAGEYNIVIKDRENCTVKWENNPVIIKQPEKLELEPSEYKNITGCNGDQTGEITINVKGGTKPYSYYLNTELNYSETGIFKSLPAGNYIPVVKDDNGCQIKGETEDVKVTITEPSPVIIKNITTTDVSTCFGDNSGKIEINAEGGTSPIYYLLKKKKEEVPEEETPEAPEPEPEPEPEPVPTENNVYEGLFSGTYTIYVEDKNQCPYKFYNGKPKEETEEIEITLEEPEKFEFIYADGTSELNKCYKDENGIFYLSGRGGTLPYTFTASTENGYTRTETFDNGINNAVVRLPAGQYTISANDKNGCTAEETFSLEITQPEELVLEKVELTHVDCFSRSTGKAVITATGGTGSLSYGFKQESSLTYGGYTAANEITGLSHGKYNFTVKDANKCEVFTEVYEITQPERLVFTQIKTHDILGCYGDAAGEIDIQIKGGTGPYLYSIDGGDNFSDYNIFKELPYSISYIPFVIDANGCTAEAPRTSINQPPQLVITSLFYHEVEGCNGTDKGAISFKADGGSGVWKFSVDGVNFTEAPAGSFPNLKAGTYRPIVEDSHGCRAEAEVIEITEAEKMELVSVDIQNAQCYGKTGSAEIKVKGGKPYQKEFPYYFYINDAQDPSSYDGMLNFLSAGNYTYKIQDKYLCTIEGSFSITQPGEFVITGVESKDIQKCSGDETGEVKISISGGTAPVTFSASGYNYYKENNTGVFKNMPASKFVLTATDQNGCSAEDFATIEEPEAIIASARLSKTISCHDDGDAEITVTASGGTGNLSYSVDGGKNFNYTEKVIKGLKDGTYVVKVRDENGCVHKGSTTLIVNNPAILEMDYEYSDVICHDGNTGKIIATASGGTKPYFYSLDSVNWQQSTGLFSNLSDGVYTVTVHDQNDCVLQTEEITLKRPQSIAGFSVDKSSGCSPLKILITQDNEGLFSNYEFSNGDKIFDRTLPTEYTFINNGTTPEKFRITSYVMQNNGIGCTDTSSIFVTVYPLPQIDLRMGVDSVMWPENTANFGNLTKNTESVHWDFGDGSTSDDPSVSRHEYTSCGNYNIVLSVNDGRCENSLIKPFKIEPRPIEAVFNSTKLDGCQPVNITVENVSVNTDSCKWDFGDGSNPVYNVIKTTHTYAEAGDYILTLIVYGDCGSLALSTKKVSVYAKPEADFEKNLDTLYSGQFLKLEAASGGIDSYIWNFGDGKYGEGRKVDHKYEFEGTFNISLTVLSANSCSDTASIKKAITVINNPIIVYPTAFTPNGDGVNDLFKPVHGDVAKFKLVILNRKGVIVYKSDNIEEGWDGTRNGKPCPPDMYVWKAVSILRDKQILQQKGSVYLMRPAVR